MIKILFLINTLGGGGAERVLVNLVNHMDKAKFDITVETMFSGGVNERLLQSNVRYIKKNKLGIRGLSNIIRYIPAKLLYQYYIGHNDYDIVVAYMHGAPTKVISGCENKKIKRVTWLHNGNPGKGTFFRFWPSEKKAFDAYAALDAIVGVSRAVTEAFHKYTGISKNLLTLYNTNDSQKIRNMSQEPWNLPQNCLSPIICTSGRLSAEKGFDRLIFAAKKLWDEGLHFHILIMGSGPEKEKLISQIQKINASAYITMMGFCENPYSVMKKCDFYVSSSREEGLATVLIEALTLGMPVVSTDVSGAKEVLGENNEYGMVVSNDVDGIYHGLKTMLCDQETRERYRSVAKERAVAFNTENTVAKTEAFFERLVSER